MRKFRVKLKNDGNMAKDLKSAGIKIAILITRCLLNHRNPLFKSINVKLNACINVKGLI